MKKLFLILTVISLCSFQNVTDKKVKRYPIFISVEEAQAIIYIMDKSKAEHDLVEDAKKIIISQFNAEIAKDTTIKKK